MSLLLRLLVLVFFLSSCKEGREERKEPKDKPITVDSLHGESSMDSLFRWYESTLPLNKPFTPTRGQWLQIVLNQKELNEDTRSGFIGTSFVVYDDKILVYIYHSENVTFNQIEGTKGIAKSILDGVFYEYPWAKSLKVEYTISSLGSKRR